MATKLQIYTSHGPTLIAPTWFMSRKLYDAVGGFDESRAFGYPEDLKFFYDALKLGVKLIRVRLKTSLKSLNECTCYSSGSSVGRRFENLIVQCVYLYFFFSRWMST